MGQEFGKIIEIKEGEVTVALQDHSKCNSCAAKSLCTLGAPDSGTRFLHLKAPQNFSMGEKVLIYYRESSRILSALLVFVIPVLMMFGGYWVSLEFGSSQGRNILGAFAGLGLSGLVLYALNKWLSHSRFIQPSIKKIYS